MQSQVIEIDEGPLSVNEDEWIGKGPKGDAPSALTHYKGTPNSHKLKLPAGGMKPIESFFAKAKLVAPGPKFHKLPAGGMKPTGSLSAKAKLAAPGPKSHKLPAGGMKPIDSFFAKAKLVAPGPLGDVSDWSNSSNIIYLGVCKLYIYTVLFLIWCLEIEVTHLCTVSQGQWPYIVLTWSN